MGEITQLMYSGINPDLGDDQFSHTVNDFCHDTTNKTSTKYHPRLDTCTRDYYNQELLAEDFKEKCIGKKECALNLRNYLKRLGDCVTKNSKMFVQYKCDKGKLLGQQHHQGLIIAALGLIICWAYAYTIYYLDKSSSLDFKKWDVNTVTVSDFTVQITITKMVWAKWLTVQNATRGFESEHIYTMFKSYIKKRIEEQINQLP